MKVRVAVAGAFLLLTACGGPYRTRTGLEVAFEGNDRVSDSKLWDVVREEASEFATSGRETLLSDACFRIVHLYELEGREKSEAAYRLDGGRVVFSIREARYYALGKIRIRGATALPEDELIDALPKRFVGKLPYSPLLLRELSGKIAAAYEERGFKDVAVGVPEVHQDYREHRMDVTFPVQEGKRFVIRAVEGLESTPPQLDVRLKTLIGKPYSPRNLEELQAAVLDYYQEHGYPFVGVDVEPAFDGDAVTIRVKLDPGPYATLGTAETQGRRRASEEFVRGRADLEPGREYRASDLRRAEERLMQTSLFDTVRADPGAPDPDTGRVPVVLRLEERDPGEVSLRLGYGTLDGGRAGVDFRYANLFGNAEQFRAGGTISRYGYRADAELAFPYFLGSEFRPALSGYYQRETYPSFDATAFGEVVSLAHPLFKNSNLTGGVRHATIRTSDVEPGVPPGDLLDFSYIAPFVSVRWDSRDNPLLPTRGGLADTRLEYSGEAFSRDIQFWNLSGRFTYLVGLPAGLILAGSFQGGVIAPIQGTTEIPISLRYFSGGINSVRGFSFASLGPQVNGDATGGEAFMALQLELRFPIWEGLHGAVFTDRGGVWESYKNVDLDELRYSLGAGLRFHTPAGPLVADFALNPARESGEEGWAFHFSIGFPF